MTAVDTMTKRYETALNEKKKEYETLYMKKATILKSYNEKVKALRLKGLEISELIAKAKTDGAADKGLIEILNKWEEANQKIFERQGEGEDDEEATELSLLEVAHAEINKSKEIQAQANESMKKQQQSNQSKKKKEEEEMRRYMEELKKKEEEL